MRRRPALVAVLLLGIAALVALVVAARRERPVVVDVEPVARRAPFRSWVTASGEIVAGRFADIGSSVMGRLVSLPVREGDAVRAGQVLARIDPVPAASQADAARAALAALESEHAAAAADATAAGRALARARALAADGVAARADLDGAEAAADAARARLEAADRRVAEARARLAQARDALAKTEITAPRDGVVTRLPVREGEMVVVGVQNQPGTILMTVSDLSAIDAEVKVAEADVLRLATGQPATVTLEALPGREFPGRVAEIGASALPAAGGVAAAREFRVLVRLEAPDPGLKPGLTCDVRVLVEERPQALTVPLQAVALRAGVAGEAQATGVFRVEDGRARFRPVSTGIQGGLEIEIEGLSENDEVVVGPYAVLRDLREGARVRPRETAR